jgi:hypothetical protein
MAWKITGERRPTPRSEQACATIPVAADATLNALRSSTLWAETARYLRLQTPTDQWREACWRSAVFHGVWSGQKLVAVYAVHVTEPETPSTPSNPAEHRHRSHRML